jgi:hypothetical protein
MSPIFFSESICAIILKFTYNLSKVEIIVQWSLHQYQHTFFTLTWIALYWSYRTIHWSVRILHMCFISSHQRSQHIPGMHPSGEPKQWKLEGAEVGL